MNSPSGTHDQVYNDNPRSSSAARSEMSRVGLRRRYVDSAQASFDLDPAKHRPRRVAGAPTPSAIITRKDRNLRFSIAC